MLGIVDHRSDGDANEEVFSGFAEAFGSHAPFAALGEPVMLAGEIDYECDPVLGTLAQVQAGTVRALAIAAKQRSPMLPDVPTSDEQGLGEFEVAVKYAVFAPKGTPKPIVEKLAAALDKGLDEPEVKKRLGELGADNIAPGRRGPKPLADQVTELHVV